MDSGPKSAAQEFFANVEWLDSLARRKWHNGLGRMVRLVELLELQNYVWGEERPLYIHIAGTNGKGSVTSFVKALLLEHGLATGAAFSPYVDDFRERVQFGRQTLCHRDFLEPMQKLIAADKDLLGSPYDGASAFELKTALGFLIWKAKGAEAVALEVGMGGRLDASNVVQPSSTVIVSIGWDHKEVLGDTLAKIASEKAGIIKQGVPLILGSTPPEAEDVILNTAATLDAPVWKVGREIIIQSKGGSFDLQMPGARIEGIAPRLYGLIQHHNAALAIASVVQSGITLDPDKTRKAIKETQAPGRFEERDWQGIPVILDGAHNEPAARNLAQNLKQRFPGRKIGLLLSMLQGHDPVEFLSPLKGVFGCAVAVTGTSARGRQAADLLPALKEIGLEARMAEDRRAALELLAEAECEAICATGSFYGLTQVREAAEGNVKS